MSFLLYYDSAELGDFILYEKDVFRIPTVKIDSQHLLLMYHEEFNGALTLRSSPIFYAVSTGDGTPYARAPTIMESAYTHLLLNNMGESPKAYSLDWTDPLDTHVYYTWTTHGDCMPLDVSQSIGLYPITLVDDVANINLLVSHYRSLNMHLNLRS